MRVCVAFVLGFVLALGIGGHGIEGLEESDDMQQWANRAAHAQARIDHFHQAKIDRYEGENEKNEQNVMIKALKPMMRRGAWPASTTLTFDIRHKANFIERAVLHLDLGFRSKLRRPFGKELDHEYNRDNVEVNIDDSSNKINDNNNDDDNNNIYHDNNNDNMYNINDKSNSYNDDNHDMYNDIYNNNKDIFNDMYNEGATTVMLAVGVGVHADADDVLVWPPIVVDPEHTGSVHVELGHVLRPLIHNNEDNVDNNADKANLVDLRLHMFNNSNFRPLIKDASLVLSLPRDSELGRDKRDGLFVEDRQALNLKELMFKPNQIERRAGCERLPMQVDLSLSVELSVVLAPRTFDAGTCGGSCPSGHDFNWHAFLHNLMNSATMDKVGPTRCAPAIFADAMIVVEVDDDFGRKGLKLAQLKDAVVKKCACM